MPEPKQPELAKKKIAKRLYMNFFQPVMKIVAKTRHGAKVHKLYDVAQTPYQRLLNSGVLADDKCRDLTAIYHSLNPELLLNEINCSLEKLWMLEENTIPANHIKFTRCR